MLTKKQQLKVYDDKIAAVKKILARLEKEKWKLEYNK